MSPCVSFHVSPCFPYQCLLPILLHRPKDTSNPYYKLKSNWQVHHVIVKVFDEHNYLIEEERGGKEQVVHRNHLRKLPEGMRGNLAAGEVEEGSFVKGADEDKLGLEDESEGEEERESSEEDSESDEDYFYPDVREIGEPKEWNLRETCSNPGEVEEFERTIDPNGFRRTGKENGVNREVTSDENVDFWEMSSNWQKDRDNLSESSSVPDIEQLIKNVIKEEKKLKNSGQQTGEHETSVIEQNRRKWEGLAEETGDERKNREAEELEKSREEAELE